MQGMVWGLEADVEAAELSEWDSLDSVVVRAPQIVLRACGVMMASNAVVSSGTAGPSTNHGPVEVVLAAPGGTLTARQVLNAVQRMLVQFGCLQLIHSGAATDSSLIMDGLRKVSPAGCMPIVYEVHLM
jgi:hypothetical protein